jgi:hypothetical protein
VPIVVNFEYKDTLKNERSFFFNKSLINGFFNEALFDASL